jgi:nucleoid DNA-binding protein
MAAKSKKAPVAKKPKVTGVEKPRTKGQVFTTIAEQTELSRKQVAAVFEAMTDLLKMDLKKPGVFQVPGLMKVTVIRKPATKARMAPNPFKPGEMMQVKAKPARNVVKVRALKGLKALV